MSIPWDTSPIDAPPPVLYYLFILEDGDWATIPATDDQTALDKFRRMQPNAEILLVFECTDAPQEVL